MAVWFSPTRPQLWWFDDRQHRRGVDHIADGSREEPKSVITGQETGGEATGEGGKPKLQRQRKELRRNPV